MNLTHKGEIFGQTYRPIKLGIFGKTCITYIMLRSARTNKFEPKSGNIQDLLRFLWCVIRFEKNIRIVLILRCFLAYISKFIHSCVSL